MSFKLITVLSDADVDQEPGIYAVYCKKFRYSTLTFTLAFILPFTLNFDCLYDSPNTSIKINFNFL